MKLPLASGVDIKKAMVGQAVFRDVRENFFYHPIVIQENLENREEGPCRMPDCGNW